MKVLRSSAIAVVLIALGLALSPRPAFGQGSTWVGVGLGRVLESAMWRAGNLRANVAFQLRDAGYDSDIYYCFFGETVPDSSGSAGFPVQLLLSLSKKVVLEVYDAPRYDFYLKTKTERAWNNTLRSQIHFVLTRVYFRVGGEMADNRRRLSQELDINIREKTKRVDSLLLWQASRSTSLAMLYDRTDFDYGDVLYHGESLGETLNRKVDSLEFAWFVHSNPRFRFFTDGQYANYDFGGAVSQVKNTRSYAAFAGFVSVIQEESPHQTGRIDGYARLGYMKFDVLAPGQPDGDGLVGDVDLSVGIFRLTNARLYFSKGFEFSIYTGATFYAERNFGGGITRLLSRRTSVSYDLTFGQSSYPRLGEEEGPFSGVLYRFTTHRLYLSSSLSRFFRVSLTGTMGRRVTAETGQAWKRYIIALSLDYGTPSGADMGPIGGLLRASSGISD
jgi:hypothetical protein